MRLPRMTTRRWMISVAALAVTLGGHREATRLKRYRDEYLARAASHVAAETYYRRLVSSSESSVLNKRVAAQELAVQESTSLDQRGIALDGTVERWFVLAQGDSTRAEEEAHDRFREAQARADAMVERARMMVANNLKRQLEHYQRQAEYHAALGRKYATAAARPWFAIAPDPPKPK